MALFKHIQRLKYIDYIIKRKATGNLNAFAQKNGLCRRAMADVLKEMKELGFPIKYDKNRNSYCYTEEGEMVKKLFTHLGRVLTREEAKQIGSSGNADNLCFSEINVFEPCKNS